MAGLYEDRGIYIEGASLPTVPIVGNAIQSVASATGSGTNTSRFAADDHVHAGVPVAGISGGNTAGQTGSRYGSVLIAGGNNITVSGATAAGGQTITISGPNTVAQSQESNTLGMSDLGNTAGTSGVVSGAQVRYLFAGGNNITLSQSLNGVSGTLTIVGAAGGAGDGFNILAAGTQTAGTATTVAFVDSNGLAFGMSASTRITGSYTRPVASNAIASVGTATGSGTNTSRFAADDHVHAGIPVAGISGGNTLNTSGPYYGSFMLAGGNNVTLSAVTGAGGQTVTISGGAGGGGFLSAGVSTGGNTLGTTGLVGSQLLLVGGANITLSQSSVAGGSATVTIVGPAAGGGATIYTYEPYGYYTGVGNISLSSATSAAMMLFPFEVPQNVGAEAVGVIMSMSFVTGGASSYRQTGTLNWGLYTRPSGAASTELQLAVSNSFTYAVTYNNSSITYSHPTTTNAGGGYGYGATNSAGLNISSGYTGLKYLMLGLNSVLTPGAYWLGLHHRNTSSSFNSGVRMSLYGRSVTLGSLAPMGSFSTQFSTGTRIPLDIGGNWHMGLGSYSLAALTSVVGTVSLSQVTQNLTLLPYMAYQSRV